MRSSKQALKDFIEGSIWKDLSDELRLWLEDIRDRLEDSEGSLFMEDIKRLQGNAEAIRNVLVLPKNLLETLEEDK